MSIRRGSRSSGATPTDANRRRGGHPLGQPSRCLSPPCSGRRASARCVGRGLLVIARADRSVPLAVAAAGTGLFAIWVAISGVQADPAAALLAIVYGLASLLLGGAGRVPRGEWS